MDERIYYRDNIYSGRRGDADGRDSRREYSYGMEGSAAYDFSLFEEHPTPYVKRANRVSKTQKNAGTQIKNGPNASKNTAAKTSRLNRSMARAVAIGMLLTVAVGALISCQMEYNEIIQEISAVNSTLTELQFEYEDLSMVYETKMNNASIETYATDTLGMQKRDNSITEYITIGNGDVFDYTGDDNTWLQEQFDKLLSYMD